MKKILIVFGTRPEAIKMAPLINKLKEAFNVKVCVTAQHREMLDQVLNFFNVTPDFDLDVMSSDQELSETSAKIFLGLKKILTKEKPNLVLVHGDTTTTLITSIASFYLQIPVGHVEAGLRTYNLNTPFPEEFNRQVVSKVTKFHFAPTDSAKKNLLNENFPAENIFVTGNTVIDALLSTVKKVKGLPYSKELVRQLPFLEEKKGSKKKIILVTGHRRENFGEGLREICASLKVIASENKDVHVVYPVHLNPNVIEPVNRKLSNTKNIHLIEPLDYPSFIKLMNDAYLIITDSGGMQEEAPSLGKPVLVMREVTERPEAVEAGTVKLVGTDKKRIVNGVRELLSNEKIYMKMSKSHNPYGDGLASSRIFKILNEVGL